MSSQQGHTAREHLPIPDSKHVGLTTYDAKDPDTKYPRELHREPQEQVAADSPIPTGKHQVRMEFACGGGGLATGGDVTLYYDATDVLLRRRGV